MLKSKFSSHNFSDPVLTRSLRVPDSYLMDMRFLIGTNTSGKDKEHLQLGHVEVPTEKSKDRKLYNYETGEIGGPGKARKPWKFEITQKINHEGEVNKARYMPQNPDIIATLGVGGTCYIFDRTKHPNNPVDDDVRAQMKLVGHTDEGFGLHWNPREEGMLATTSQDSTVRIWNIKDGFTQSNSQNYQAQRVIESHQNIVNDVQFHAKHRPLFASCSEDRTYHLHDLRKPEPILMSDPCVAPVNCLTWNPSSEYMEWVLLTGLDNGHINAWDVRNPKKMIHSFEDHEDAVVKIEWAPADPTKFASASYDRTINWWDCAMIGKEQSEEDAEDGPPEMYVAVRLT
jgi:histone-binding protein RBBP4